MSTSHRPALSEIPVNTAHFLQGSVRKSTAFVTPRPRNPNVDAFAAPSAHRSFERHKTIQPSANSVHFSIPTSTGMTLVEAVDACHSRLQINLPAQRVEQLSDGRHFEPLFFREPPEVNVQSNEAALVASEGSLSLSSWVRRRLPFLGQRPVPLLF